MARAPTREQPRHPGPRLADLLPTPAGSTDPHFRPCEPGRFIKTISGTNYYAAPVFKLCTRERETTLTRRRRTGRLSFLSTGRGSLMRRARDSRAADRCSILSCDGALLPEDGRCFAHVSERRRLEVLQTLRDDPTLTFTRGLRVPSELLERILEAAPHDLNRRPYFKRADFTGERRHHRTVQRRRLARPRDRRSGRHNGDAAVRRPGWRAAVPGPSRPQGTPRPRHPQGKPAGDSSLTLK